MFSVSLNSKYIFWTMKILTHKLINGSLRIAIVARIIKPEIHEEILLRTPERLHKDMANNTSTINGMLI